MRARRLRNVDLRLAFLPWLALSFALTGCPLSDHYSLESADAGDESGAGGMGGAGASAGLLGMSGALGVGGSAGTSSGGSAGAMNGGSGGTIAGSSGIAGTSMGGNGGSAQAGAPEAGEAGLGPSGGEAGMPSSGGNAGTSAGVGGAGSGGVSGSAGTAGSGGTIGGSGGSSGSAGAGGACTPSNCGNTCCGVSCVDLTRDYSNCGACGVVCNSHRTCGSSHCTSGWVSMAAPPVGFVARWRAAATAIGTSVFIWGGSDSSGGVLDSGAIYDPVVDTWTPIAKDAYTPTARVLATAVWTGSVVVVFGGSDAAGATPYKDGAIYDPAKNAWSPILPASRARSMPLGYWDGTRAVFYGGINGSAAAVAGADRFDLSAWTSSTAMNDPGAILNFASAWDGDSVLLQGGQLNNMRTDKVASYTSTNDTWATPPKSLSARSNAFGTWDGSHFVVWGGRNDFVLLNDGKYLSGNMWPALATTGAPSARMSIQRRHGWMFQTAPGQVALFGGQTSLTGQGTFSTGGYTYDVAGAKWTVADSWPSGETHDYGVAVWTGEEFVLWGGRTGSGATPGSTLTGERWAP